MCVGEVVCGHGADGCMWCVAGYGGAVYVLADGGGLSSSTVSFSSCSFYNTTTATGNACVNTESTAW